MNPIQYLQKYSWFDNAFASLLLVIAVLILRQLLVYWIRRSTIQSSDLRRRWIVQIRNACFLLVLMGLIVVWATELRTVAFSLLAFLVAFVLATKELILCLTGGILKVSSDSFQVGDRIELNAIRGDVIDQTLLATRIMEIGPGPQSHMYTGKTIVVPNSLFLNTPILNHSLTPQFVFHMLIVPLKADEDWQQAEADLLAAANAVCQPYIEQASKHILEFVNRQGLEISTVNPRIALSTPEPGRINLNLRVPLPGDQVGRTEQEIIRRYLINRDARKKERAANTPHPTGTPGAN